MPRFMAIHTIPMTEEQGEATIAQRKANPLPAGMANDVTWVDFASGKIFCEWVAPSREAIIVALNAMRMPFDEVYPVRKVDWTKYEMEPAPETALAKG